MTTHPDFEELFRLLEEHRVDYMIVGGYAVAFHGYPRFTKDIDIFFRCEDDNIDRLRKALIDFGFEDRDLPVAIFLQENNVLTFGVTPTRVDLMHQIDGVNYAEARPNVQRGSYGEVEVTFIGLDDLLRNKRATHRTRDQGDVEELTRDRSD